MPVPGFPATPFLSGFMVKQRVENEPFRHKK